MVVEDLAVPKEKAKLLTDAEARVADIEREFRRGFITEDERYTQTVEVWRETTEELPASVRGTGGHGSTGGFGTAAGPNTGVKG